MSNIMDQTKSDAAASAVFSEHGQPERQEPHGRSKVSHAVGHAVSNLEEQLPHAAAYVRRAADSIEQAADALRRRSIPELLSTGRQLARQQPAVFFGSAILAGFALSRFLKSSTAESAATRDIAGEH